MLRDFTSILHDSSIGNDGATDRLMVALYDDLHAHADRLLRRERPGRTFSPTAVVHEAYLRLVDVHRVEWKGRTHFKAMAARSMQRVLIDAARARAAAKRGGDCVRIVLDDEVGENTMPRSFDFLVLHEAIERLSTLHARYAEVVKLRFFGGMSLEEIAAELGLTTRTIKRDWRAARTWLLRELDS